MDPSFFKGCILGARPSPLLDPRKVFYQIVMKLWMEVDRFFLLLLQSRSPDWLSSRRRMGVTSAAFCCSKIPDQLWEIQRGGDGRVMSVWLFCCSCEDKTFITWITTYTETKGWRVWNLMKVISQRLSKML